MRVDHQREQVTVDKFFEFIWQPENVNHDYELINGRIVPVVTDGYASQVALEIAFYIRLHMRQTKIKGRVTGEAGGFMIKGKPYIPDVAFMSYARQPEPAYDRGYNVLAPDLAVEVLSPGNTTKDMSAKVADYITAGTVVWLADPATYTVTVFVPGQPSVELTSRDTLTGGDVLPGFSVAVSDLFPPRTDPTSDPPDTSDSDKSDDE